jgi:hypothetical protein
LYSNLGKTIVEKLRLIDKREANGVEQYFCDMQQCFEEMYRILKFGGRTAIVIGDTDLKKVKIHNADVFVQTLERIALNLQYYQKANTKQDSSIDKRSEIRPIYCYNEIRQIGISI